MKTLFYAEFYSDVQGEDREPVLVLGPYSSEDLQRMNIDWFAQFADFCPDELLDKNHTIIIREVQQVEPHIIEYFCED